MHCRELIKHDAFVTVWGLQSVSTLALQHSCRGGTAEKQMVFFFFFLNQTQVEMDQCESENINLHVYDNYYLLLSGAPSLKCIYKTLTG